MNRLFDYLEKNGICLCNVNSYLPALEEIGCGWQEVSELIDSHLMFYSKAFRGRTAYLSREVYLLLDMARGKKTLTAQAEYLYRLLENNPPGDTRFLKEVSAPVLTQKSYKEAFDFLLKERYITAVQNGKKLNENWSCFLYGTAGQWEEMSPRFDSLRKEVGNSVKIEEAGQRLWEIVGSAMSEKDFKSFIKI